MNLQALYQNDGSVVIYSRYSEAFVRDLRVSIPNSCLTWRRYKSSWLIAPSHADVAIGIFKKHFPGGVVFVPRSLGGAA